MAQQDRQNPRRGRLNEPTREPLIALLGASPAVRALAVRWVSEAWQDARIELLDTRVANIDAHFGWHRYGVLLLGEMSEALATYDMIERVGQSATRPATVLLGENFAAKEAARLHRVDVDYVLPLPFTQSQVIAAVAACMHREIDATDNLAPLVSDAPGDNALTASRLASIMDQARFNRTGVYITPNAIPGYLITGAISDQTDAPVYAALREGDSALVALKLLDAAALAVSGHAQLSAWRATALSQVTSPHVVQRVDMGVAGQVPYVAYEYLRGGTLADRINGKPLPEADVSRHLRQLLHGLADLHHQGIIHLDIKPQNLLFRDSQTLVIVDFGLAVRAGSPPASPVPGAHGGTPHYMSPEHAQGKRVDERSDLYSVGIVVFEMLAGAPPFNGDTPTHILYRQLHDEVPLLPKGVRHWQPLVDGLLHKEAIGRPASTDLVLALLAQHSL